MPLYTLPTCGVKVCISSSAYALCIVAVLA